MSETFSGESAKREINSPEALAMATTTPPSLQAAPVDYGYRAASQDAV
jgi:hypothetical protein